MFESILAGFVREKKSCMVSRLDGGFLEVVGEIELVSFLLDVTLIMQTH